MNSNGYEAQSSGLQHLVSNRAINASHGTLTAVTVEARTAPGSPITQVLKGGTSCD